nr:hypothetical protein [Ruficoccus amylovorans]
MQTLPQASWCALRVGQACVVPGNPVCQQMTQQALRPHSLLRARR